MADEILTDAPESTAKSSLMQLLTEAEAASEKMGAGNPNRDLLLRLSAALVSLAQQVVALSTSLAVHEAQDQRIILP
jgi:hypothetical protein